MILVIFLILLIFIIKHIYEIYNINHENKLYQLQNGNKEDITEYLKYRNPILVHNLGNKDNNINEINIKSLIKDNPGYFINDNSKIISFETFNRDDIDNMNIYKNKELCRDFNLNKLYDNIYSSFESLIHCNKNYYLSLFKGNNGISLTKNKHNLLILYQISGVSIIYIFNPKFINDIKNKNNDEIKKWGIKVKLVPGLVLYIPIEWYYIFETDTKDSIMGEIECDNYFTFLYNSIR